MKERWHALFWAVSDTAVMAQRNLWRYVRLPRLLVFSTIQPVMFVLLFAYVFGGAINTGAVRYIDYLLPGVFVQAVVFGSTQTGVGLAEDLSRGMVERFRSLPMARPAVLAGRTLADVARNAFVVALMVGVGTAVGFRFHGGVLSATSGFGLALFFGFAFSWMSAFIGMWVKDAETAQVASFVSVFPLVFASSMFVPIHTMPGWLQAFAKVNPVTLTVDAVRALALGAPAVAHTWRSLASAGGLILLFAPLSVRLYQRSL